MITCSLDLVTDNRSYDSPTRTQHPCTIYQKNQVLNHVWRLMERCLKELIESIFTEDVA
jgi:hypothetical protein